MDIHGNINLKGNQLKEAALPIETAFPENPSPGRFCFVKNVLYFCTELAGGLPVWVPLTEQITMKRFVQREPALEWTIAHNLNTNPVVVQVYDGDGKWILPDQIISNEINLVTVTFATPMIGTVIVMRGASEGTSQESVPYTAEFVDQSVWVVNHGLGFNPFIQCVIGTNVAQPESIVHNSLMQSTVTWSSPQTGSVRCN